MIFHLKKKSTLVIVKNEVFYKDGRICFLYLLFSDFYSLIVTGSSENKLEGLY